MRPSAGPWEEQLCLAAEVLAREGLAAIPAHELAAEMRVSVGSMYRAYGSKSGVARRVVMQADDALSWQLQGQVAYASERSFRGRLEAVWWQALRFSQEQRDLFAYAQLHWRHPGGGEF